MIPTELTLLGFAIPCIFCLLIGIMLEKDGFLELKEKTDESRKQRRSNGK